MRLRVFVAGILCHQVIKDLAVLRRDMSQLVQLALRGDSPPESLNNIRQQLALDHAFKQDAEIAADGLRKRRIGRLAFLAMRLYRFRQILIQKSIERLIRFLRKQRRVARFTRTPGLTSDADHFGLASLTFAVILKEDQHGNPMREHDNLTIRSKADQSLYDSFLKVLIEGGDRVVEHKWAGVPLSCHIRQECRQGYDPVLTFAQHIARLAGSGFLQSQLVKNTAAVHPLLDQLYLYP